MDLSVLNKTVFYSEGPANSSHSLPHPLPHFKTIKLTTGFA